MSEKILKPQIRFKGFTDAWEQRNAKELCSITTGKSNTQDQVDDGKYPFYIRSDMPVKSNKFLFDEEAVITIGDGNIGKVFHYVNGKFDLHQRCYKMADFSYVLAKYFYWYFSTKFYKRAMSMTAKATVDSVRLEMISDMSIKYPENKDEQSKISAFLFQLDSLITLHQRKYEKLQTLKKALLEKMFPANNDDIPQIRFKGFTDAWEQRKLGDCCNIFAGGTPSTAIPEYWIDGNINWLPSGNIQDCYINSCDIKTKITKKGLEHSSTKMIKKDTALLAMTGATCGKSGYLTCDSTANQSVMAFETNKLNSRFLYYTFQKNKNLILSFQAGGAQAGINKETCIKFEFKFPSDLEQKQISNLFQNLDSLITLHQRK